MAVREAMLTLLTAGPRHGYQLKAEFEEAVSAKGSLNTGQVYTTLDRLIRDGLVEETDLDEPSPDERRRPVALTVEGRHEAEAWLLSAPPPADRSRDELVSRILLALHTDAVDPLAVIDGQRRGLVEQLQVLRKQQRIIDDAGPAGPTTTDLAPALIVDAMAAAIEADLGWLDRADARVRRREERTDRPEPPQPRRRKGARTARRTP